MAPPFETDIVDGASSRFWIDDIEVLLSDFLLYCADGDRSRLPAALDNGRLDAARDRFLEGGLSALKSEAGPSEWIQFGLGFRSGHPSRALYRQAAEIAREWLGNPGVQNFFFMHKPPGIRLRFEAQREHYGPIRNEIQEQFSRLLSEGVIQQIEPGVYEPETYLFGGSESMLYVHELFTCDSLAWLDYHSLTPSEKEDVDPAWALSLLMLQAVFAALRITDWEDLDVWDRVRRRTGRGLPDKSVPDAEFNEMAADLRARWLNPQILLSELRSPVKTIAGTFQSSVRQIGEAWHAHYFSTDQASLGPRAAAALLVIFHWNGAQLSLARQSLITEALIKRETI